MQRTLTDHEPVKAAQRRKVPLHAATGQAAAVELRRPGAHLKGLELLPAADTLCFAERQEACQVTTVVVHSVRRKASFFSHVRCETLQPGCLLSIH